MDARAVDGDVILIVAMAFDRVIGSGGQIPWRLPEDMRRFREATTGHPVVLGRKTFESIGKPLPGRTNIVVTRQPAERAPAGVATVSSPLDALRLGASLDRKTFVIGGAELYEATLPFATEILATFVYLRVAGDVRFPPLDEGWHVAAREDFTSAPTGARSEPIRGSFVRLRRASARDNCPLCRKEAGSPVPPGGERPVDGDAGFAALLQQLAPASPP